MVMVVNGIDTSVRSRRGCIRSYKKPGPPKEPKIMDQYPNMEGIGSIGSIILAILEVQEWSD